MVDPETVDAARMTRAAQIAAGSIYEAWQVYPMLAYARDDASAVRAAIDYSVAYGYTVSPYYVLWLLRDIEERDNAAAIRGGIRSFRRRAVTYARPLSSVYDAMRYLEAKHG